MTLVWFLIIAIALLLWKAGKSETASVNDLLACPKHEYSEKLIFVYHQRQNLLENLTISSEKHLIRETFSHQKKKYLLLNFKNSYRCKKLDKRFSYTQFVQKLFFSKQIIIVNLIELSICKFQT